MRLLYNIAAVLVVILMIPAFCVRAVREKGFVNRIRQQLGFLPKHALDKVARKNCIWVHAASVGEIVAASPLIKEFRREFPEKPILVSVFTNSGYEMANRIIKGADSIIHFPFDLPWLSAHLLYKVRPMVFMPVETELWPNFLRAAKRLNIPVMMVNGRISEKSVSRYRYLRSIWYDMLDTIKYFAMQSPVDAENILRLGANKELVTVTGNTKFDQTYTNVSEEEKRQLIRELGLADNDGIFLAGSTHRGEEEHVLAAFGQIRQVRPGAKLLIAPRAVLRAGSIQDMCRQAGFSAASRTRLLEQPSEGHDVVVLDTIGELGRIYSIGDVIFVGGSMVPHGGHNILEPAAHGKAIIVGEHMFNFKDTHVLFSQRSAVVTAKSRQELVQAAVRLFADVDERRRMEQETLHICEENRGAARRTAALLRELMDRCEGRERIKATDKLENLQTYFFRMIHDGGPKGFGVKCFVMLLQVFAYIYGALLNLKLAGYEYGVFSRKRLDCYVISLGNITVGGTGKTPTAQRLARAIRDMGYKVVILNRGYRAKWQGEIGIVSDGVHLKMDAPAAGDEAFMLAKHLPKVPVLIGPERAKTGQYAVEHFGAQVVILDDGYQHWQLERDLDVVLIDAVNVFGNGHILPRGTLREPLSHLKRADVCLLTKVDQAERGSIAYIRQKIAEYGNNPIVMESIHQPQACVELSEWVKNIASEGMSVEVIRGRRVIALSAIGNPASFEQTLANAGADVIESFRFPDHHEYTPEEIEDAIEQAVRQGAEAIATTEKDAVKLPKLQESSKRLPVYVVTVEVVMQDGDEAVGALLRERMDDYFRRTGKK